MQTPHPNVLRLRERGALKWVLRCSGLKARSLCDGGSINEGYARHSRKYSYGLVTIRKLLTRCGA